MVDLSYVNFKNSRYIVKCKGINKNSALADILRNDAVQKLKSI